jgi:hypothetical protein
MHGSKTDQKNIQLLKMLAQLREHIDIHRIIGLNGDALRKAGINGALLGYLQKSAHESLAMYICKIFEASTRNDLNSIPGLIESIPKAPLSDMQAEELGVFGKKYGHAETPTEAKVYLRDAFELFRVAHSESLGRLKEFRDTIGAHSDYRADITFLPSHPGAVVNRCVKELRRRPFLLPVHHCCTSFHPPLFVPARAHSVYESSSRQPSLFSRSSKSH